MKFRSTWILFIALVCIALYFFLVEERRRDTEEKETRASRRILPYHPRDVKRFVFINPDSDTIQIERKDTDWNIVAPVITDAANPSIESLLMQIVPGRKLDEFQEVSNLEDYGLSRPFATVILFAENDARPDTIHVGDKTPTRSSCYVQLGSSRTVLVAQEITHNVMNKTLYHLRDKNFFHIRKESIDSLAIHSGGSVISLNREGDDWWLQSPRARADRALVDGYLFTLTDAIIRKFVREDTNELGQFGLAYPMYELTVRRGTEITKMAFGTREGDQVYVVRSGLEKVFLLEDKVLEVFEWTKDSIRAMNLAFFNIGEVMAFRYETEEMTLACEARNGMWHMVGTDTPALQPYDVQTLLRKLTSIKFVKIITETPPAGKRLDPFLLSVTLEDRDGRLIDTITIAAHDDSLEIGTSISAHAVGQLKKGTLNDIRRIFDRISITE